MVQGEGWGVQVTQNAKAEYGILFHRCGNFGDFCIALNQAQQVEELTPLRVAWNFAD